MTMPSFFFAHGAPSIVLEQLPYTAFLKDIASTLPKPKAIVIFSAHWESETQTIGAAEVLSTIYDFSGFSEELYRVIYPARGERLISEQIQSLFTEQGIPSTLDDKRGLDHGAWAVLKLVYPDADIPVIALSVNPKLTNEQQYQIGKALQELREQDVLIIGSGGTVHNLRRLNWQTDGVDYWANGFDQWIQDKIAAWDLEALFQYHKLAPYAADAVPTSEHFIPLLLAMSSSDKTRKATLLHSSYQFGNLSLRSWRFD